MLITLTRPLIYLQPVAVDKAILVWLNYKNAYEYWAEQRGGWIKKAHAVADKLDKLGVGVPILSTLLTTVDFGRHGHLHAPQHGPYQPLDEQRKAITGRATRRSRKYVASSW